MPTMPKPIPAVILSGTVATAMSVAALALAGAIERRGAWRPINATSHWLHGDAAARRTELDLSHTGVGAATHAAATLFWAVLFETLVRYGGQAGIGRVPIAAGTTSVVAAIVDYRLTPRRFTPGWEHALRRRSMAAVYAAMAVGLALGRRSAR